MEQLQALLGAAPPRGPGRGARHRPEPPGHRRAVREPVVLGRAAPRPGLAVRAVVRHRLDRERGPAAAAGARRRRDARARGRRAALLRPPLPAGPRHLERRRRPGRGARPPALRAGALEPGEHRAQLPPVLRRHDPRRRAAGGPGVFDATHELVATLPAAGVTGLRVDHPDGLVDPAGYLEQPAEPRPGRLDHRREDPRARRGPPAVARRGDDRLRRHARGQRRVRRLRRRALPHRPLPAPHRRPAKHRRPRRGGQADGRRGAAPGRGEPDGAAGARGPGRRPGHRGGRRRLRRLPLVPARRGRAPRRRPRPGRQTPSSARGRPSTR